MCITHVLQSRCKTFQEKVFNSRKVELFVAFRGLCFCQEPSKINDESPQHAAILSLQSQGPKGLLWGSAGMAGTRKIEATNLHQRPVFFRCKVILPKVPWEESFLTQDGVWGATRKLRILCFTTQPTININCL